MDLLCHLESILKIQNLTDYSVAFFRFKTRNTYKRHLKTRHGKVLTQSGGIIILSEEEFLRVRTAPRCLQARVSNDKENNRRPGFVKRNKPRKAEVNGEEEEFVQKYSLSGNWSTNLLEPELESSQEEVQTVTVLQAPTSGPTTVMLLSVDNTLYKDIAVWITLWPCHHDIVSITITGTLETVPSNDIIVFGQGKTSHCYFSHPLRDITLVFIDSGLWCLQINKNPIAKFFLFILYFDTY